MPSRHLRRKRFSNITESAAQEAARMVRRQKKAKRPKANTVLRLPNLEQSKNAALNSVAAATSQESYGMLSMSSSAGIVQNRLIRS
jgi:hypothetical protein